MKRRNDRRLYFVALVPDEPLFSKVMALKEEVKQRFASAAALRSPPHITLHMPVQWLEAKEGVLVKSLEALALKHQPFFVQLNGFGAFPPRVIYVHVEESEPLTTLQAAVQKNARRTWHIHPKQPDLRGFTPHMTIAFRDLKKPMFQLAWEDFASRPFSGQFLASDICLLKHNGKSWDIFHRSPLAG